MSRDTLVEKYCSDLCLTEKVKEYFLQVQGKTIQLSCAVLLTQLHPQFSQSFVAHLTLLQRTYKQLRSRR